METIPEKPAILEYVEEILSSGHLLMPGGLMQQPFVFMREFKLALALRNVFEQIKATSNGE